MQVADEAAALDAHAADAKKRKRDLTPEHLRAQPVPEEKLLRSDEPRSRHREAASSAWTLQLPRPLVSLLRDLCERLPVEHFITVRAVAHARSIDLSGRWTVETSHESSRVLPRWMQEPALLRPEQDGELMVTMHTHPRAAITQSLNAVPSLRRRQQLARTSPLLYVPSLADVNNMLRYGMHVSIVRRTPRHFSGERDQPLSRMLERAASKVVDFAAFWPSRHVHIVVTPFHWFVCHVPFPSTSTELEWDMQSLLAESEGHEQTAADWARLMNAKCDHFSVVLLPVESIDFEYEGAASGVPSARGVPWVHCDSPPFERGTFRTSDFQIG